MRCPDCKIEMMIWSGERMSKDSEILMRNVLLWKCPKCQIEIEDDEEQ